MTGALHEDGLADVGDGFGGGRDRAAKLVDHARQPARHLRHDCPAGRLFGELSALASLPPAAIIPALIVAHALGRAPLIPVLAASMPFARDDGLGKSAGRPDAATAITAVIIAIVIALLCLAAKAGLDWRCVVTAAGAAAMAALAWRQIGGVTGDVFGAAEQVVETAVLLMLAAQLS